MNIEAGRTATLWFLLPSFCLDTEQADKTIGLAVMFLNWQICINIKKGE